MMIDCFRFGATTTKMTTKTTKTAAAIVVMIMVTMTMSRETAFDKKVLNTEAQLFGSL